MTDRKIEKAAYDRTVIGTIEKCLDPFTGKYQARYDGASITAYAFNNATYSSGQQVYLLIPQGDLRQEKQILGVVTPNRQGVNNISTENDFSQYQKTSEDIFENKMFYSEEDPEAPEDWSKTLWSTETGYEYPLSANIASFENKLPSANLLMMSARVYSALPLADDNGDYINYYGDYGIKFYFKNAENKTTVFTLDSNSVIGNPYFPSSTQFIYKVEEIDGGTLGELQKVEIFYSGFGDENSQYIKDNIHISDIQINTVVKQYVINRNFSIYITSNGYWKENEEDSNVFEQTLTAIPKVNGVTQEKLDGCTFTWYQVDPNAPGNDVVGQGWAPISGETNQSLVLKKSDQTVESKRYRCVAKYNDAYGIDDYDVINQDANLSFRISHIPSTGSYSCEAEGNGATAQYKYLWSPEQLNQTKSIAADNKTSKPLTASMFPSGAQTINCYCHIYTNEEPPAYLATAYLDGGLWNPNYQGYSVEIINGDQIFAYDEGGNLCYAGGDIILSYRFRDQNGELITEDERKVEVKQTSWTVPTNNTIFNLFDDAELSASTLTIKPDKKGFNATKNNNNITLTVSDIKLPDGTEIPQLVTTTNFQVIQQGQPGTNGTNYYIYITETNATKPLDHFVLTKDKSASFTVGYGNVKQPFGELGEGAVIGSVKWELLTINSNNSKRHTSTLKGTSGTVTVDGAEDGAEGYQILKVTATINSKEYYDYLPIVYANSDAIKLTGGFNVLYDGNGQNPKIAPSSLNITNAETVTRWDVIGDNIKISGSNPLTLSAAEEKGVSDVNAIIGYQGEEIAVYIPIVVTLNTHEFGYINQWDGQSIQLNEEEGRIIAPGAAFGSKNDDNTFTGVMLGKVETGNRIEHGLFGYKHGARTFGLDAETGDAVFSGTIKGATIEGVTLRGQDIIGSFISDKDKSGDAPNEDSNFYITQEGNAKFAGFNLEKIKRNYNEYQHIEAFGECSDGVARGIGLQPPWSGTWAFAVGYTDQNSWATDSKFKIQHDGTTFLTDANLVINAKAGSRVGTIEIGPTSGIYISTDKKESSLELWPNSLSFKKAGIVGSASLTLAKKNENEAFLDCSAGFRTREYWLGYDVENAANENYGWTITGPGLFARAARGYTIGNTYYEDKYNIYMYSQIIGNDPARSYPFKITYSNNSGALQDNFSINLQGELYTIQAAYAAAATADSDINLKNTIQPFTDKHDILFDNLQGVTFKYNNGSSNRTHFGFIAQPTAKAAEKAGISLDDFAPVCIRNISGEAEEEQTWGIRYEEFVALNTDQIQKAKKRISELETKCSDYEARIRRLEELILPQQGGDL